jgi:5-methylcytosine-specific restriction protein A
MHLFARHPFCQICQSALATIRDHRVNLAAGGRDTPDNEQALCAECHDKKTAAESLAVRR